MNYIDITGPLANDMWQFGEPFPKLKVVERKGVTDGFGEFSFTTIEGLHALTGTYLETPAHYLGYENSYLIADVPLKRLMDIPCVVLNVQGAKKDATRRQRVEKEDLLACKNSGSIRNGDAILVGVGWGDSMWRDQRHFPESPYFSYDAFMWLLSHEPCILGSDTSCWDDLSNPSGLFEKFYERDILMLAGLKNLAAVKAPRTKLIVLPLPVENSCASPCRAVVVEE
ncbi:MAG: cyclase family protein [Oscillospiraceae bacterium]|nr:cyclase family protein [Oscillospiraceae bacterium]